MTEPWISDEPSLTNYLKLGLFVVGILLVVGIGIGNGVAITPPLLNLIGLGGGEENGMVRFDDCRDTVMLSQAEYRSQLRFHHFTCYDSSSAGGTGKVCARVETTPDAKC